MANNYLFIITPDISTNNTQILEVTSDETIKEAFCTLYNEHVMMSVAECADVEDHYITPFTLPKMGMEMGVDRISVDEYGCRVQLIKR